MLQSAKKTTPEQGKPQRPPASAFLCIDSEDRYGPATLVEKFVGLTDNPGNDFIVSKKQPLLYGIFHRVAMTQLQMQYRVPTIVPNVNDQFVIEQTATQNDYLINLPAGFYSATTLAAAIQTAVLAIPANPFTGFTCVYNPLVGGLVMSTTGVTFQLPTSPGGLAPFTDAQQTRWLRTLNTIGANNSSSGWASTQQVLGTPQLLFTRYIDITSSRLAKFQRVKDADTLTTNKTNHVCRVYLTAPNTRSDPTAVAGPLDICIDPNTPKHSMWSIDEAIYELDFQLWDEFGQPLFWSNFANTEFQMTLMASET